MRCGGWHSWERRTICRWWRRQIGQDDLVHGLPIIGRNHLDRVPRTAVEKRAVGTLADTFLTPDTEIRIDFDSSKRRVIFVRHPEHASFDRAVFDASGRARAS